MHLSTPHPPREPQRNCKSLPASPSSACTSAQALPTLSLECVTPVVPVSICEQEALESRSLALFYVQFSQRLLDTPASIFRKELNNRNWNGLVPHQLFLLTSFLFKRGFNTSLDLASGSHEQAYPVDYTSAIVLEPVPLDLKLV